jgi:hypothetical protein
VRLLIVHEHQTAPGKGGGGAESMLRDQTAGLRRLGHEVAWLQSNNIEQAISEWQPDIVQLQTIHNAMPNFEPAKWVQANNFPHVWALMDYWPFCWPRMLLMDNNRGDVPCNAVEGACDNACGLRTEPEILALVNRSPVVALNRYTADIYRRNGLRVDYVVELGVDTELFAPDYSQRNGAMDVYTTSAWPHMPVKGMHILKEALAGTGIEGHLMTDLTREQIAVGLKRAHIFVFPSVYEETWGLCLNEAMASGCACISSDVAGPRAQIEDGVTGLLVPKRDPDALRAAILRLVNDPILRVKLGRNARAHVEREHNLDAVGRRFEAVYREVLG